MGPAGAVGARDEECVAGTGGESTRLEAIAGDSGG